METVKIGNKIFKELKSEKISWSATGKGSHAFCSGKLMMYSVFDANTGNQLWMHCRIESAYIDASGNSQGSGLFKLLPQANEIAKKWKYKKPISSTFNFNIDQKF